MSIWCLSGIVMMYVQYPEMVLEDELAGLELLDVGECCALPNPVSNTAGLSRLRIEMMAGRPVLRIVERGGRHGVIDLTSGSVIDRIAEREAHSVAASYAQQRDLRATVFEGSLARDQWTVYGAYDVYRPLYRYSADDASGTEWYVSSQTGEVVQVTTRGRRFWNWLGAVPHWLYPTVLRQHTYVWSQVVVWLTIAGIFLTVFGVYVGIKQFKSRRSGRFSPYRGFSLWHHYAGLVFGIFTLTWLVSGFFSMQPWGALESRSFAAERDRLSGSSLMLDEELSVVVAGLASRSIPAGTVRLEAGVVNDERYFMAWNRDGNGQRLDGLLRSPMPVPAALFSRAAASIKPGVGVLEQGLIHSDDAYYYSHHDEKSLPVYRISYADGERFYLDPQTAEIVYAVDESAKLYRWIHYGLHRGDFALLRARPIWDIVMLLLMAGVTIGAFTGTWMGLRRMNRWRRRAARTDTGDSVTGSSLGVEAS